MRIHTLEQEQLLPITPDQAWDFFSSPANLDEITPDDLGFQITSAPEPRMYEGQIITYRVRIAPGLHMNWVTEIKCVEPGASFIDEQRFGPYRFWHHRHTFEAVPEGVLMRDKIHYALPFGPCGAIAHALFVRRKLRWIFHCRREILDRKFPMRPAI
jgi:ligand-binding SRPBCC domain-containing protein